MDARLQRRVQRHGWNLAAADYTRLWGAQLAPAHRAVVRAARLAPGERVLDLACGGGALSLAAARAVGCSGEVIAIDVAERMVEATERAADAQRAVNVAGLRMDAEALAFADGRFDAALCALGLMYLPAPERALREARRVLRAGGRFAAAVWGEPAGCGWAAVFAIVEAEVRSEVCPLFFRLGRGEALARACAEAGFEAIEATRFDVALHYADADAACDAAFVGGPVALAWSRFHGAARTRVRTAYLAAIEPWREGRGYRLPGQFVVVAARAAP